MLFKYLSLRKVERKARLGAEVHSLTQRNAFVKTMKTSCETEHHVTAIVCTDGITGSFTFFIPKEK